MDTSCYLALQPEHDVERVFEVLSFEQVIELRIVLLVHFVDGAVQPTVEALRLHKVYNGSGKDAVILVALLSKSLDVIHCQTSHKYHLHNRCSCTN